MDQDWVHHSTARNKTAIKVVSRARRKNLNQLHHAIAAKGVSLPKNSKTIEGEYFAHLLGWLNEQKSSDQT